jgi:hypothetical protein
MTRANENGRRIMGACPPEQMTTLQLIRLFVRYASTHRGELPGDAVVAVFRALGEVFPCRAEHRAESQRAGVEYGESQLRTAYKQS